MTKKTDKEYLLERVKKLPDDVTMGEAMSWLLSLRDVEISLQESPEQKVTLDEVEEEFKAKRKQRKKAAKCL